MVIDLSTGIPGAYCTKLLADGGATVLKLEPPEGDPLRRWTATGRELAADDGALFQFLACSKQSVVVEPNDPAGLELVEELLETADAAVWSRGTRLSEQESLSPWRLRQRFPRVDVVALSPFGLEGPWAGRAATEFTLQAWAGAIGHRGFPERPPVSVGGRVGEWATGVYAALGLLASIRRSRVTGVGELLDTSMYEAVALTLTNMHPVPYLVEAGRPRDAVRSSLIPGIHPTKDGWVGFMTGTGQQWLDFCVLVERFDWLEDLTLVPATARSERRAELVAHIENWTRERTTEEVVEHAADLRVPVSPVVDGRTAPLVHPTMYTVNARGGFSQPITPYTLHGRIQTRAPSAPPVLGEHTDAVRAGLRKHPIPMPGCVRPQSLPFDDLRVVELTAFWAGPSAGQALAMLGAEVIKVESPTRPDGMRTVSTRSIDDDLWWEHAPLYRATNTGKLGFGLRLDCQQGLEILRKLLDRSDVLIENYSPRVLDSWALDYEQLRRTNPRLVVVRMPAFGLTGPWRDRTGFAQTMEQASGMAWVTGFPDAAPTVPNGPCDPLAGVHAAVAVATALASRDRTGVGMLVEVPMVLSALNVAAEQAVEASAYGTVIERMGNRSPVAVPQDLYKTGDPPDGAGGPFVAISVATDDQWAALVRVLGAPAWAADEKLATLVGRRSEEAAIEAELAAWCATRRADDVVEQLWSVGVPVGKMLMPHAPNFTQLDSRGFFEYVYDPIVGRGLMPGLPVRFSSGPHQLHRRHAPQLGQHNDEVLGGILGLDLDEIRMLETDGIVGRGLQASA